MRVLVRPFYPEFLSNRMFQPESVPNGRWIVPYARWRTLAANHGMLVDTWDMHPVESADVILYCDLPATRRELLQTKAKAPHAKLVLMLVESPMGRPNAFHLANHELFDAVLTFNWRLCDDVRYFRYYLPIDMSPVSANPSFSDRLPLVMINSNRLLGPMGLFAFRHPGLVGLPAIGWWFRDWKIGTKWFRLIDGELYTRRRKLARLADVQFPGLLSVFGPGWSGEPTGWVHKFRHPKPFQCARGPSGKKDDLLPGYRFCIAFENMTGDVGYISEKIFDSLAAGVVPIYLGDERIAEHVDPACFVDARRFDSDGDMLQFVRDCPESEWNEYREAGQTYIRSEAARKFQPDAFAQRMVDVLQITAQRST